MLLAPFRHRFVIGASFPGNGTVAALAPGWVMQQPQHSIALDGVVAL
jgi:hypothetical protein